MAAPTGGLEVVECTTCRRLFKDIDGTHVCPLGHENPWVEEDHEANA